MSATVHENVFEHYGWLLYGYNPDTQVFAIYPPDNVSTSGAAINTLSPSTTQLGDGRIAHVTGNLSSRGQRFRPGCIATFQASMLLTGVGLSSNVGKTDFPASSTISGFHLGGNMQTPVASLVAGSGTVTDADLAPELRGVVLSGHLELYSTEGKSGETFEPGDVLHSPTIREIGATKDTASSLEAGKIYKDRSWPNATNAGDLRIGTDHIFGVVSRSSTGQFPGFTQSGRPGTKLGEDQYGQKVVCFYPHPVFGAEAVNLD